jgi:hypothetical protein
VQGCRGGIRVASSNGVEQILMRALPVGAIVGAGAVGKSHNPCRTRVPHCCDGVGVVREAVFVSRGHTVFRRCD